jgi:hypothetical protein
MYLGAKWLQLAGDRSRSRKSLRARQASLKPKSPEVRQAWLSAARPWYARHKSNQPNLFPSATICPDLLECERYGAIECGACSCGAVLSLHFQFQSTGRARRLVKAQLCAPDMYSRIRSAPLAHASVLRGLAAGGHPRRSRFRGAQSKSVSNRQRAISRPALAT